MLKGFGSRGYRRHNYWRGRQATINNREEKQQHEKELDDYT
jgi:hypothetical protein